jgi:hypothetical protein
MTPRHVSARLLPALALLVACGAPAPTSPETRGQLTVLRVAPRVAESWPLQVTLEIEGRMPTACSELDEVAQRRDGARVDVAITTRERSEVCIKILPAPIRLDVPLRGGFLPGEYVASVNGFELKFRL